MDDLLKKKWLCEEAQAFTGWDFSHLDGRWTSEPLPWDYGAIVRSYLKPELQLLDMGTGGGEFLLSLGHPHGSTSVTESWLPNVELCRHRLAPLGIRVFHVTDDRRLPLPDRSFDIITNRHASYDADEVFRILKPGGIFVTQQVGALNNRALAERVNPGDVPLYPDFSLKTEVPKLLDRGFDILYADEYFPELCFYDVGAVVYFAKAVPWEYPNFSVTRNLSQLYALQAELQTAGSIKSWEHRYIIAATKTST